MIFTVHARSAKEVAKEIKAIKEAGREICKTPETARAFLVKHGFITKSNKLAKRYR